MNMTIQICRICLCTDTELLELNENLLDYFKYICDYTSGISKYLFCFKCKDSLKDNLDFRNKCLKSNKILREWTGNLNQKKAPLQYLQRFLQTPLNDIETQDKQNSDASENIPELSNGITTNQDFKLIESINSTEIKEEFKEEVPIGIFEDYGPKDNDDEKDGNQESDDEKLIIEFKRSKVKSKSKEKKIRVKKQVPEKRIYPRKGPSEYLQYEDVFKIQLFKTDEEARAELLGRRESEPFLSAAYRCDVCYTVYKCDKLLQFHMKWHDGPGDFACDICSMRFSVRKALQCHKAKCHRGRFTCKLCPLITYYGSAMKAHFQKHQGKTFKCEHCGGVFNHISSYLSHKRTVHASRHVCVTCARTFVSELGLLNHRLRTHQTKSIVDNRGTARCAPCGLTFVSQQVYTVHVLNTEQHKDIATTLIACQYCGLSFEDVTQLKTHKRQNHPKKKDTNDVIKCKLCGEEGVGRTWRRRHYAATHPRVRYLDEVSEAKLHMCERCGKRFSNICLMKDHLNKHLGLRPYACVRCRATFHSAAARNAHVARHSARTPNLYVHVRTTNGAVRRPSVRNKKQHVEQN